MKNADKLLVALLGMGLSLFGCVTQGTYVDALSELESARNDLAQARAQNETLNKQRTELQGRLAQMADQLEKTNAALAQQAKQAEPPPGDTPDPKELAKRIIELQAAQTLLTQELDALQQRNDNSAKTIRLLQRTLREREAAAGQPTAASEPTPSPDAKQAPTKESTKTQEPPAPPPPSKSKVGKVLALTGKVNVNHSHSPRVATLAPKDAVYDMDLIATGPSSKVKIRFFDGHVLTLGEQSNFEISQYGSPADKGPRSSFLTLAAGTFRAVVNKLSQRGTFVVQTPTAIATVRGTDWAAEVKPDGTGVLVIKGAVTVTNQDPEIKGEQVVTDGLGSDIKADSPPWPPKKWGQARIDALLKATELP